VLEEWQDALDGPDRIATSFSSTLRSRSLARVRAGERLYVIESPTFTGTWIYTKGTIRRKGGREVLYVFVSAKLAT